MARTHHRRLPANRQSLAAIGLGLALTLATQVQAAGSGMPWEAPLQQVLESEQGPVAKIVAVIIIIVTGLPLAIGETPGGLRRLSLFVFRLTIASADSPFIPSFFTISGGALG